MATISQALNKNKYMNYPDMIDPADPMSVLVAADWLEESGCTTEANALRELAPPLEICDYVCGYGYGFGDGHSYGFGDGYGFSHGYEYGYGFGDGHGFGDGYGFGHGHGYGYGDSHDELHGDGHSYGKGDTHTKINKYLSHMRIFLEQVPSV